MVTEANSFFFLIRFSQKFSKGLTVARVARSKATLPLTLVVANAHALVVIRFSITRNDQIIYVSLFILIYIGGLKVYLVSNQIC